jgi:uncharacterized protein YoxC
MSSNMSNNTPSADDREAIVDKLHGALAVFRRECDELHRKKQLAVERLRLEKEEKDATEKTVHGMQETLNQLNKSGSEEAKTELERMEKDVEQINREVRPPRSRRNIVQWKLIPFLVLT